MDNQEQNTPQQVPFQTNEQTIAANTSWLKTLSVGFAIVSFGIAIGIGGYVLGTKKTQPVSQNQQATISPTSIQPSPTPDPTANWKTYSNNIYSFKYPATSDWKVAENNSPLGTWVNFMCSTCENQNVDYLQIVPITTTSLDAYINNPVGTSDFTKTTIDGIEAVKAAYAGSAQAGGSSIKVFFVYKGLGYEIDMRFRDLLNVNKLNIFPPATPDILSTFKLTN